MEPRDNEGKLWRFTGALFKSGLVEQWCLAWQDQWNIDISLMFWAAWMEHACGVALDSSDLRSAIEHVKHWREGIILPVRSARRFLKTRQASLLASDYEEMKKDLRSTELAAERLEQAALLSMQFPARKLHDGSSNIARYLGLIGGALSAEDRLKLGEIDRFAAALVVRDPA